MLSPGLPRFHALDAMFTSGRARAKSLGRQRLAVESADNAATGVAAGHFSVERACSALRHASVSAPSIVAKRAIRVGRALGRIGSPDVLAAVDKYQPEQEEQGARNTGAAPGDHLAI